MGGHGRRVDGGRQGEGARGEEERVEAAAREGEEVRRVRQRDHREGRAQDVHGEGPEGAREEDEGHEEEEREPGRDARPRARDRRGQEAGREDQGDGEGGEGEGEGREEGRREAQGREEARGQGCAEEEVGVARDFFLRARARARWKICYDGQKPGSAPGLELKAENARKK